jgi:hypothetical protein
MNLDLKTFKKLPSRWNKKWQANSKNLEGGETTKQQGRLIGKTWKEDTKSHINIP